MADESTAAFNVVLDKVSFVSKVIRPVFIGICMNNYFSYVHTSVMAHLGVETV